MLNTFFKKIKKNEFLIFSSNKFLTSSFAVEHLFLNGKKYTYWKAMYMRDKYKKGACFHCPVSKTVSICAQLALKYYEQVI